MVRGVFAEDDLPAPIVAERTITWGNDIGATRPVAPFRRRRVSPRAARAPWSTFLLLMNPPIAWRR